MGKFDQPEKKVPHQCITCAYWETFTDFSNVPNKSNPWIVGYCKRGTTAVGAISRSGEHRVTKQNDTCDDWARG